MLSFLTKATQDYSYFLWHHYCHKSNLLVLTRACKATWALSPKLQSNPWQIWCYQIQTTSTGFNNILPFIACYYQRIIVSNQYFRVWPPCHNISSMICSTKADIITIVSTYVFDPPLQHLCKTLASMKWTWIYTYTADLGQALPS